MMRSYVLLDLTLIRNAWRQKGIHVFRPYLQLCPAGMLRYTWLSSPVTSKVEKATAVA